MLPAQYEDIGHGLACDHSAIWRAVWSNVNECWRIEARSARKGTHATTWGDEVKRCWRGRFDTKTKQVSVVSPERSAWENTTVCKLLVDLLVDKFGDDIEIWTFDPVRCARSSPVTEAT